MGTPAQPYYPQIDKEVPAKITVHLQRIYPAINDHDKAIVSLKAQFDAFKTAAATTKPTAAAASSSSSSSSGGSSTNNFTGLGTVNNQTGNVAYTVQQSDSGAEIVLSNAAPVAITLNSVIVSPFFCFMTNLGTSTATLTPTSGTINGGASFLLPKNSLSVLVFSGGLWFASAVQIVPLNTPTVAHQWLASYDDTTGLFTLSQPTAADVVPASSTTVGRPVGVTLGFMEFDTTLGIPIWWNGAAWVNASGAPV